LGTFHPEYGADISHRGGFKGFVRVVNDHELRVPDYRGNTLFNSLGNIVASRKLGMLFINFNTGNSLQLSGEGDLLWQKEDLLDNAERTIKVTIHHVVEIKNYCPLRFSAPEYSLYNPTLVGNVIETLSSTTVIQDKSIEIECVDIKDESYNIKTFKLQSPIPISYIAGQYASFKFGFNNEVLDRTWTISSSPLANLPSSNIFEVTIKKLPNGKLTPYIHKTIQIGSKIKLMGIDGQFIYSIHSKVPEKSLMIAGGIGITPLMAMIRNLNHSQTPTDIILLYSVKTINDRIFASELEKIEKNQQLLKLKSLITITQTEDEINKNWNGLKGRISIEMMTKYVEDLKSIIVFLCCPELFMNHILEILKKLNFAMDNVILERFDF